MPIVTRAPRSRNDNAELAPAFYEMDPTLITLNVYQSIDEGWRRASVGLHKFDAECERVFEFIVRQFFLILELDRRIYPYQTERCRDVAWEELYWIAAYLEITPSASQRIFAQAARANATARSAPPAHMTCAFAAAEARR
jgi:hypothetical protein